MECSTSSHIDLQDHWLLYPPPGGPAHAYRAGDFVFVWLKSDRDTGRARVVEPAGADGRVLVAFDVDPSLTHRVRPGRLVPVFSGAGSSTSSSSGGGGGGEREGGGGGGGCVAVVCAATDSYRRLARSQVTKADAVLEVGCSAGVCTALLAQHAGRVVGADNSPQLLREAKERCPGAAFELVDALASPDDLARLGAGCGAVFVDIGGNRELHALVALLPWVQERLRPRLLVVKSEALAEAAAAWLTRERRGGGREAGGGNGACAACSSGSGGDDIGAAGASVPAAPAAATPGAIGDAAAWWCDLRGRCAGRPASVANNPLFYKAKARGFKGVHPMRFPDRALPGGGRRVCRPFNYAVCHAGDACAFDHAHCHHCLQAGHAARECTL
ncbi:MAG: hypothetical protein J3K34DRAFT_525045 [Monoraphidium minutum]|nr:MAG: hypothetical protein J3K34DRAFT_525045 [Monoraphidium minutum]